MDEKWVACSGAALRGGRGDRTEKKDVGNEEKLKRFEMEHYIVKSVTNFYTSYKEQKKTTDLSCKFDTIPIKLYLL